MQRAMRAFALALVVVGLPALAQERWDHNGSIGVHTGFGIEGRTSAGMMQSDSGLKLFPELGVMVALSERWQIKAAGRFTFIGNPGLAFLAGMRSLYGKRFKTFFDLDLNVHALPIITIGPRVAFGVQYELASIVGVFASGGVLFGVGPAGIRFGVEAMVGLQLRSYLLE